MREFHALDMRQPPRQKRRPQLDHAFLPIQTSPTEATMTPGYVTDRNGTRRSIAADDPAIIGWAGGVIDFTSDECWWVQIKYVAETGSTQGDFEELRWEKGASFPAHRANSGYTINIPVIEFPDNDWPSMIRRQTNDIIDSPHDKADLGIEYDAQDPDEPWPTEPEVRGTPELFNVIALRAYLTADDALQAPDVSYNSGTMYLFRKYDWVRAHG